MSVDVRLPGASPDEMSSSVAEPLEQALSGVAGVDQIESRLGVGQRAHHHQDSCSSGTSTRRRRTSARRWPARWATCRRRSSRRSSPRSIRTPSRSSAIASAARYALRALTEIADKRIRRALEAVNGVGEVTVAGGRSREIHVELDVEKLSAHGLSVGQVRDAIVADNVEVPGGRIDQGDAEVMLRTPGRFEQVEQFGQIVVATEGRHADPGVATSPAVKDTEEEARTSAFLDGERAWSWTSGGSRARTPIRVIEDVKAALDELEPQLPPRT